MELTAVSLGYAVPREDFTACVHSIFHKSVNLQSQEVDGLLTLSGRSTIDLPQGIRVDPFLAVNFDNLHLGQNVFCHDGFIFFQGNDLRIDIRTAYRWKCHLPSLVVNLSAIESALTWGHVWEMVNASQKQAGNEIILENLNCKNEKAMTAAALKISNSVRKLILATRQFNLESISAAAGLIGLGSGLTPGGDDLLAGYLTGLWCTVAGKLERHRFTTKLGNVVIDLSSTTNDISRTYLFHAAKGQAASYLVNIAQLIGQGEDSARLKDAVDIAQQVGHSSGLDAVTGLLLGLSVWTLAGNPKSANSTAKFIQ
jgi:hypothetical protein